MTVRRSRWCPWGSRAGASWSRTTRKTRNTAGSSSVSKSPARSRLTSQLRVCDLPRTFRTDHSRSRPAPQPPQPSTASPSPPEPHPVYWPQPTSLLRSPTAMYRHQVKYKQTEHGTSHRQGSCQPCPYNPAASRTWSAIFSSRNQSCCFARPPSMRQLEICSPKQLAR
jgi:hypothetical protein